MLFYIFIVGIIVIFSIIVAVTKNIKRQHIEIDGTNSRAIKINGQAKVGTHIPINRTEYDYEILIYDAVSKSKILDIYHVFRKMNLDLPKDPPFKCKVQYFSTLLTLDSSFSFSHFHHFVNWLNYELKDKSVIGKANHKFDSSKNYAFHDQDGVLDGTIQVGGMPNQNGIYIYLPHTHLNKEGNLMAYDKMDIGYNEVDHRSIKDKKADRFTYQ